MSTLWDVYSPTAVEAQILGAIIAPVAYGVVIQLSAQCMSLHLQRKRTDRGASYSRLLPFYITGTLLIATAAYVQNTIASVFLVRALFQSHGGTNFKDVIVITSSSPVPFLTIPLALPFSVANADIYMVWRCIILYTGSPLRYRGLFYCLLGLSIATAAAELIFELTNFYSLGASVLIPPLLIASATFVVNIVISLAITLRILYQTKSIRRAMGVAHVSVYTKVINIVVESCMILSVGSAVHICLTAISSLYAGLSLQVLPQLCAISPLLIILRVEQGRDITSHVTSAERVSRPMQFAGRISGIDSEAQSRNDMHT